MNDRCLTTRDIPEPAKSTVRMLYSIGRLTGASSHNLPFAKHPVTGSFAHCGRNRFWTIPLRSCSWWRQEKVRPGPLP